MEDIRRVHAGILEPIAFFFVHHRWCARAYRQSSFSSAIMLQSLLRFHLCPPAMVVQCLLRAHPPHVMVTLSANCTRHDHGVNLLSKRADSKTHHDSSCSIRTQSNSYHYRPETPSHPASTIGSNFNLTTQIQPKDPTSTQGSSFT